MIVQQVLPADTALAESSRVADQGLSADSAASSIDSAAAANGTAAIPSDPSFFKFFEANADGILVFFLAVAGAAVLLQWGLWVLGAGRFRPTDSATGKPRATLRYLFAEGLVKIIDDFRHFLALIIMLIFAGLITYAMVKADTHDMRMDALKGVVAALGGLVGSIIGYYFGESRVRIAAAEASAGGDGVSGSADAIQESAPSAWADKMDIQQVPDPRDRNAGGDEGDSGEEDPQAVG